MTHPSLSRWVAAGACLALAACQAAPGHPSDAGASLGTPPAANAPAAGGGAAPVATAGAGGQPIKIGLVTGLSGTYAGLAQGQERGAELAVDEIGSVLGRPLQLIARDDKIDPNEAAKQAEALVQTEQVDVLTGCVSAATTLAVNEVAKRAKVPYLGTCQTNALNDGKKDWSDVTFHMALTPWMNNQMVLPWITESLGKKVYIFAADYAWGSDNIESISAWLSAHGLAPIGQSKAPLGTKDFTTFIPQIRAAAPEVTIVVNAGDDQANFLKQANQFGLSKESKLYSPVVDLPFDKQNGQPNIAGTYGGANFYWQIQDQLPSAKKFVDAYQKKFNEMPAGYGSYQYDALKAWADAATRAGSLEPSKLEAALEGMTFEYSSGQSFIRKCDHQMIHPVHIMQGRTETQGDAGYRDLVTTIAADERYERTCDELGLASRA
jgi:branched-chain amino acid transport system substrate-binding protein